MTKESIETLREMGFNVESQLTAPTGLELGMNLTIIPKGNVTVLFCNNGQAEYDTLANHGAVLRKVNQKSVCAGCVPYLTVPTARLPKIFRSIAMMRELIKGATAESWKRANEVANAWIASLPSESNVLYAKEVTLNEYEETI